MKKATIKPYTHGLLKDGRRFQIREFKKICICEDGSVHSGIVELEIDGKVDIYPISALAENINYMTLPTDTLC